MKIALLVIGYLTIGFFVFRWYMLLDRDEAHVRITDAAVGIILIPVWPCVLLAILLTELEEAYHDSKPLLTFRRRKPPTLD